jgi:diguanylate cyclase (GGDEF)-like protein
MSTLLPAAATALPLLGGWSAHTLWLRRRLRTARRDPLTGLHTRAEFEKAAARLLARHDCAVVMVDLDGFKQINDTHGHAAGDIALCHAASAFTELFEFDNDPAPVAARLGGDEFAAVVPRTDPVSLPWLLGGLHNYVCVPFRCEGYRLELGASVGGVFAPAGTDLSVALRRADEAMYTAKRTGGGWHIATPEATPRATVNGRRAGREGTHHDVAPEGGAS